MASKKMVENAKQDIKGLARVARALGYRDPHYRMQLDRDCCVGDIIDFFEDNPGALGAVFEWILEQNTDREGNPLTDKGEEEDTEEDDENA